MDQRSWNGGTDLFTDPGAWTPPGMPASGDILGISAGTVLAVHQYIENVALRLTGPVSEPPELVMIGTTIGPNSLVQTSAIPQAGPSLPGAAVVQAWGYNVNLGTIAVTGTVDIAPRPASMTLNIHPGVFQNGGTILTNSFGNLNITNDEHAGIFHNDGEVDVGGHVRITAATLGHGTFQFGTAGNLHGSFLRQGLEFEGLVGSGQIIDFSPFSVLQIDDLKRFHATISDFNVKSGFPYGEVESIVLKGVEITSLDYKGGPTDGVLTLKSGNAVDGHLSFSGEHTTSSFQVSVVNGDTHLTIV